MKSVFVEAIKSRWEKFSRSALTRMVEPLELIEGLQEAYGYTRERAEREVHEFQLTLRPRIGNTLPLPVTQYGRRVSDS